MKQSTCRCFQRENELPLQVKVHAPRRDERRRRPPASSRHRQRQRRHRDAVRIVRVDDVGPQPLEHPRQPPGGRQVHFGPRRERNQLEPFGGPAPQLAVGMRHERRALADRAQAVDGQQHLVLAAAPGARRVDVQREHIGSGPDGVVPELGFWRGVCSSHSFANFRNT